MLRSLAFRVLWLLLAVSAGIVAQDAPPVSADAPPISGETRTLVVRSLTAEFVFARRALPNDLAGVAIRDGRIVSPTPEELDRMVVSLGAATKPGDRVQITRVTIRDNRIVCEINGGPKRKTKWHEHVQVGIGPAETQPRVDEGGRNPSGTVVELLFARRVPEMTGNQVRQMLSPLFDFTAKSAAEAYLETVPPKVKEAIKNHAVLVGMNREMVIYALGRPERRIRERDEQGQAFEEWLYGKPPQEVQFVRFVGDEVVRLTIMKVNGEKIVRSEREVEAKSAVAQESAPQPPPRSGPAPSLRRPGEVPLYDPKMGNPDAPVELPPCETPPAGAPH
jgi:hypothetical protein